MTIQPQRVAVTTELAGRTSAYLVAEVRPQVGGIVQERLFTEGSDVTAGEVLYRIDPAHLSGGLRQRAGGPRPGARRRQRQRAGGARHDEGGPAPSAPGRACAPRRGQRGPAPAEGGAVRGARGHQRGQQAGRRRRHGRGEAGRGRDPERRGRGQRLRGRDRARRGGGPGAEADIAGAEAALEAARINLARTEVTAPISGRIGRSAVTTGALVTANQAAALATIQQLDPVYVDVTESAANLLRLRQSLASGRLTRGGAGQAAVRLRARERRALPAGGDPQVLRRHGAAGHRLGHAAHGLPQPGAAAAAGDVRPRRSSRRGRTRARSSCRSGASRATRRASPWPWWSAPTRRWRPAR